MGWYHHRPPRGHPVLDLYQRPRFCGCAAHQHQLSRVRRGCRMYEGPRHHWRPWQQQVSPQPSSSIVPNRMSTWCPTIGPALPLGMLRSPSESSIAEDGVCLLEDFQAGSCQPAKRKRPREAGAAGVVAHCAVLHGGFQRGWCPGDGSESPCMECWWNILFSCVQDVACCVGPCVVQNATFPSSNQTRPRRRRRRARMDRLGKRRGPPVLRASIEFPEALKTGHHRHALLCSGPQDFRDF